MLDTSDEFELEFEMVIWTDLLLWDHKNSSTRVYLTRSLTATLMGLKNNLEQSMIFEPSEFELA